MLGKKNPADVPSHRADYAAEAVEPTLLLTLREKL